MKYILILILTIGTLTGCAQNQTTVDMQALTEQLYNATPKHQKQPIYGLQVDKKGCRLSILINKRTLSSYFKKGGYSITQTLNGHIKKSGTQYLTVMVYPREGMDYIDDLAYVDLQLFSVKQKGDPMDTYQVLNNIMLPKGLKDKNLPYFEMEIAFEAEVPWDHSSFYNNLTDLRKIPDIEKKVLAEYEKVRRLLIDNDELGYANYSLKHATMSMETCYMTKKETEEYIEFLIENASPLKNKEVLPIRDYELVFDRNGTEVFLRNKYNRNGALLVEYGDILTEGEYKGMLENISSEFPTLALPKGKNEFECL